MLNVDTHGFVYAEWRYDIPCMNRWEEFDDGANVHAAMECWQTCNSRKACLRDALKAEIASNKVHSDASETGFPCEGIRGGYTAAERRQILSGLSSLRDTYIDAL